MVQAESVREQFHDIFVEHGVDIVFAGHDHYYYRTVRDDIQYVVTGGGGAPLYDIQADIDTDWQPGDVGFSDYHYCVCRINNVTNQLDVEVFLMGEDTPVDEIHLDLPEVLTNTTDGEIIQIPWDMVIVVVGGAGVVIVVLVLIVRKRR